MGVVDVELLSDQHDAAPDPESVRQNEAPRCPAPAAACVVHLPSSPQTEGSPQHLTSTHPPQHLVGRLFYPCSQDARHSWLALPGRRGVAWLPQWQYSWGVARFLFFRARGAAAAVLKTALAALSFVMNSTQLMDWHPVRTPATCACFEPCGAAARATTPRASCLASTFPPRSEDRCCPSQRYACSHPPKAHAAPLQGAPLVAGGPQHPVVVFSHGLGGNRILYSITCSELASQGYVVLALEHADGSASACKLAGGKVGSCRLALENPPSYFRRGRLAPAVGDAPGS